MAVQVFHRRLLGVLKGHFAKPLRAGFYHEMARTQRPLSMMARFPKRMPQPDLRRLYYTRSYEGALEMLSTLESNRSVTRRFEDKLVDNEVGLDADRRAAAKMRSLVNHQAIWGAHSSKALKSLEMKQRTEAEEIEELNKASLPDMGMWLWRAGYSKRHLAQMRHIHVAGTRGKGTVCTLATAMLMRYKVSAGASPDAPLVGTYTSPHLISPRERIAINGKPISQGLFTKAFFELWDRFTDKALGEGLSDTLARSASTRPFYFRYLTIMAWHIFLQHGIKDVVMECGIGGEHDATNLLPPDAVSASIVAMLGLDHQAMLGSTEARIAWHKAGIFKPGVRAFTMEQFRCKEKDKVMETLELRAKEKQVRSLTVVKVEHVQKWVGLKDSFNEAQKGFNLRLVRLSQALAMMGVMEHLGLHSDEIDPVQALQIGPPVSAEGIRQIHYRGRFETVEREDMTWLLDVAHEESGMHIVSEWLASILEPNERIILIFNQEIRNPRDILKSLYHAMHVHSGRTNVVSHVIFTPNEAKHDSRRDLTVQQSLVTVKTKNNSALEAMACNNVREAMAAARKIAASEAFQGKKAKVLVTGSTRLVGIVLGILEPESAL